VAAVSDRDIELLESLHGGAIVVQIGGWEGIDQLECRRLVWVCAPVRELVQRADVIEMNVRRQRYQRTITDTATSFSA
jgi:hypothetical protein